MSINIEFRGLDKFVSELGGTLLVVTDSWIIKCNVHTINIIHQRDAVLKLVVINILFNITTLLTDSQCFVC